MNFIKLFLFILIFSNNYFSANFLECDEADHGKNWKESKNIVKNFYIFSEERFNLLDKEFSAGSYYFNRTYGALEGPHKNAPTLKKIPIRYFYTKKHTECGPGLARLSCSDTLSYIDRETLEIVKYYLDNMGQGFFRDWKNQKVLFKVSGECKIIKRDSFLRKTLKLIDSKSKKNKI